MREQLRKIVKEWTENNIDIEEDFNNWCEFLTKEKYIQTYDEIYQMELEHLSSEKEIYDEYYDKENSIWNVDKLINDDNDIEMIIDGLYFVHNQSYIDKYIIDDFYEYKEINNRVKYAYRNLNKLHDNFNRAKSLLIVLQNDFGIYKHYLSTDIQYTRERMLIAIKDILNIMYVYNNDNDYSIELFVSDNTKSQYQKLIKDLIYYTNGYDILKNSDIILESDAILFETDASKHTVQYYTYDNIDELCDYIEDVFSNFVKFVLHLYDREEIQQINQELGEAIDNCWDRIDFDYYQFYEDYF